MADIERVRQTWPFPAVKPDVRAPRQREPAARAPVRKPRPERQPAGGEVRPGRRIDEYA